MWGGGKFSVSKTKHIDATGLYKSDFKLKIKTRCSLKIYIKKYPKRRKENVQQKSISDFRIPICMGILYIPIKQELFCCNLPSIGGLKSKCERII